MGLKWRLLYLLLQDPGNIPKEYKSGPRCRRVLLWNIFFWLCTLEFSHQSKTWYLLLAPHVHGHSCIGTVHVCTYMNMYTQGKGCIWDKLSTLQPFGSFDLGKAKVLHACLPIKLLHKHLRCRGALLDWILEICPSEIAQWTARRLSKLHVSSTQPRASSPKGEPV